MRFSADFEIFNGMEIWKKSTMWKMLEKLIFYENNSLQIIIKWKK